MVLEPDQQQIFFANYLPLLFYASVYGGLLEEGSTMKDFNARPLKLKADARDLVFRDKYLLKDYKKYNKLFLKDALPDFVENIEKGILEHFVLLKQTKSYAVLMSDRNHKFYHISGIKEPLHSIIGTMPSLFEAAVFNFEDKMVCDGLIKGPIMGIGPNYKKQFNQDYQVAKKNKEVIERF